MRYIVYASVILAGVLAATIATGRLLRVATAFHDETNDTVNVFKLEETIDANTGWPFFKNMPSPGASRRPSLSKTRQPAL